MLWGRNLALLAVALVLTACAEVATPLSDDRAIDIQLAADGLRLAGSDQRIDFGRSQAGVIAAVSKLLDARPANRVRNNECGAGPITTVSYGAGLDLLFLKGVFRGWASKDATLVATNGFSTLLNRSILNDAGVHGFQQTSLGTEFSDVGISGILDGAGPNARVTLLWAGVNCFFR